MTCSCACHDTPGHRINRRAWIMAQIVALRARIPEVEKHARKTPAKTLVTECRKVETAKLYLPKLREELATFEAELRMQTGDTPNE